MVVGKITKQLVCNSVHQSYKKLKRPVHIADIKKSYNVLKKNQSTRIKKGTSPADRISRALNRLFKEGEISRSESLVRVENYPASPYSSQRKWVTTNVYFYAPSDAAGKHALFQIDGQEFKVSFVSYDMVKDQKKPKTKKEMVLDVFEESHRALSTPEIVERVNEKYGAYDTSTKQKYLTALSNLANGVLHPLIKKGLRRMEIDKKMVWFFEEEQLERYKESYVRNDSVLMLTRDLVRSRKCVPLTRILSELQMSPREAKSRISKVATKVRVQVDEASSDKVELSVKNFRRDSFLDWLGLVVPQKSGKGYATMLVDLESDWEPELKRQIAKSIRKIGNWALRGIFYEKLVAKLFDILCTSQELQNSELSRYMIPFVFRSDRVTNVWVTMKSGRRGEFDVLLRGTFPAFNAMAGGKNYLDIVIPIESKYKKVEADDVLAFEDKINSIFGDGMKVTPIMIGLAWTDEAIEISRRFGILTVYFSAIDKLIREMTGRKYRVQHEWKRFEDLKRKGELTNESLRDRLKEQNYSFIFEEYIEERLRGSA